MFKNHALNKTPAGKTSDFRGFAQNNQDRAMPGYSISTHFISFHQLQQSEHDSVAENDNLFSFFLDVYLEVLQKLDFILTFSVNTVIKFLDPF